MSEDEMVGWHHRLNGHEFEQAPEVGEGQGSLACCRSQGHKQSDTTEQLNNNIAWKASRIWLLFAPSHTSSSHSKLFFTADDFMLSLISKLMSMSLPELDYS